MVRLEVVGGPEHDGDGGGLKVAGTDGMVPPPGPSAGAQLSVLDGGTGTGARDPRCVSAEEALASMRWLVEEWQRDSGTTREAMSVAAVRELEEQVRDLLYEGRRIIYAGEERWPGADAEELIQAGDALVVDLLEMEARTGLSIERRTPPTPADGPEWSADTWRARRCDPWANGMG